MNISSPFVSVIMNCFNGEEFLNESINSVINQTYKNWEIIFWDNQSTDNSAKILQGFKDKRIKYFYSSKHTSLGEARNLAIEKAKGDLIAFLDVDDLWMKEKLEKQVPLFLDLQVGLVISNTIFFNEKGDIKTYYKNPPSTGFVFKETFGSYLISLETAIIRHPNTLKLDHWFDTRFEVIEEYDFFTRISMFWKIDYVDEVLGKWRIHDNSLTWKKSELFPKEKKIFLKKMIESYPEISKNNSDEIKKIKFRIAFEEAMIFWKKRKTEKILKSLIPYLFYNYKSIVVILMSMLISHTTFEKIKNIKN